MMFADTFFHRFISSGRLFLFACMLFCAGSNVFAATGNYDSLETFFIRNFKGTWIDTSGSTTLIERWKETPDFKYLMQGISYSVKGKDTVLFEVMELELDENLIYCFNVSVPTQNEGRAVTFRLRSFNKNSFVFENPAHDFPQKITYRFPEPGVMEASIEALVEGVLKVQTFTFHKVK